MAAAASGADASRKNLLGNTLVLVAPKESATNLKISKGFDLAGALGDGRVAMGEVNSVPAGIYGKAALTSLGVWDSVSAKVAGAENVRAALTFVARGEAPLGIVYGTDAKSEPKVLFQPATVTDRSDPQLVHLDGLNLSRAWCMRGIANALPKSDPARKALAESAARHAEAALAHVASGDYAGEHWLASFAVYMLATPEPG